MLYQSAYSVEIKRLERLWKHIKRNLKWSNYGSLDELKKRSQEIMQSLQPEQVLSICGLEYLRDALLNAISS